MLNLTTGLSDSVFTEVSILFMFSPVIQFMSLWACVDTVSETPIVLQLCMWCDGLTWLTRINAYIADSYDLASLCLCSRHPCGQCPVSASWSTCQRAFPVRPPGRLQPGPSSRSLALQRCCHCCEGRSEGITWDVNLLRCTIWWRINAWGQFTSCQVDCRFQKGRHR